MVCLGRSALVRISRLPPQSDGMSASQKIRQTHRYTNENIPLVVSESVSAAEYRVSSTDVTYLRCEAAGTVKNEELSQRRCYTSGIKVGLQ